MKKLWKLAFQCLLDYLAQVAFLVTGTLLMILVVWTLVLLVATK